MHAYKLDVNVAEDHRLAVDLPDDFPSGPAEVIVLAAPREARKLVQLMGSLGVAPPPSTEGDPIANALSELRDARAARIDSFDDPPDHGAAT